MADDTSTPKKQFAVGDLNDVDKKSYDFVTKRIEELKKVRKNHYGMDLDALWAQADKDYVPHRLGTSGKKILVEDETKGWRSTPVVLGSNNWQSDISQSNPFVKIQTALSILIDQNPTGVFTPMAKKFQAVTELIKQLYQRSWEYAKSKAQLKLFVFNLAKYGWATARTYPLKLTRTVKVLVEYNDADPEKSVYEEKEVIEFNDVMRENLDPRNVWMDDMARPNNERSVRDWAWRKVYQLDDLKTEFKNCSRIDQVQAGGTVTETIQSSSSKGTGSTGTDGKEYQSTDLVEVYFYESIVKDLFMVMANGVPLIMDPLPIADIKGSKKLSLWQTYWNLRHAESPYGIGIYEAIRFDQAMLDRMRNMTIDQITMSIYKMFFYQGTQSLTETGDIKITPGVGKQVLDPKNITWLDTPGPGKDGYLGIDMMRKDLDESSGIGDPLLGIVTGKTAFELAQAKEASLKRMKNPLDNILEALNTEGYITISLIQMLYSIPETYEISDPVLIDDYMNEIQGDPDLFERTPTLDEQGNPALDETGNPIQSFTAKVYRQFPLNLNKDEKGNLIETPDTEFFRVKPTGLDWEGIVNIKSQSLLSPSKQVDKALELEMYNMLIPLLAQPPEIYLKIGKAICKLYDKDPRDILPDLWLQSGAPQVPQVGPQGAQGPLIVPAGDQGAPPVPGAPGQAPNAPQAPTLVPSPQGPVGNPMGIVQKLFSRFASGGPAAMPRQ